jgi:Spy/CpxP family protein refolding chaperone
MGGGFMMSCPAMAVMTPQAQMFERVADILQLTDDQKTKLTDIIAKNEQTLQPLMQKCSQAAQALRAAILAPTYDAQKVKELSVIAEKAEADVINARIDTWTQIRSVLTTEQAAKLQAAMTMPRGPGGMRPPGRNVSDNQPSSDDDTNDPAPPPMPE